MGDKAPRAVTANSGHVAAVNHSCVLRENQSAPLGVSDSSLAEGITLSQTAGQDKQCTAIEGALD